MIIATPVCRLVRCPKCWLVLPELPHLAVYKCGGCGIILEAKKRNGVQTSEPDRALEDKESSGSSSRNLDKASVNLSNEMNQHGHLNSNDTEQNASQEVNEEVSSTTQVGDYAVSLAKSLVSDGERESSVRSLRAEQTSDMLNIGEGSINDRVMSIDTLGATDFFSTRSEISNKPLVLSKSPTTRSYQGYYDDGSVSSYDGIDDNSSYSFEHHRHSLKSSYKVASHDVTAGNQRLERDEYRSKFPPSYRRDLPKNGDPLAQFHGSRSREFPLDSSYHLHEKHTENEKMKLMRMVNELQEVANHDVTAGNQRLERDEYRSKFPPSYRRDLSKNGDPLAQFHGSRSREFPLDSSYHLHEKHTENEKMKLMRMVNELQDQLSKSCNLNGETQGRYTDGIHYIPTDYGSSWSQQHNFLHKPFEEDYVRDSRDSCSSSLDWQKSTQLASIGRFHDKGYCRVHPSYDSYASSPQRYSDGRETKSGDQRRNKDHGVKAYLREKQFAAMKNHLKPIAGAAPLVTCHSCLKQLQLPAEFLLFRKRVHHLKCGACFYIMVFSLKERNRLVPYVNHPPPPPSEIDVSSSGNYEVSFSKSYSTAANHPPFMPSDSLNSVEGIRKHSFKQKKDRVDAAKISSKVNPRSGSPLHRLMGYSSASELLRRSGLSEPERS